MYAVLSPVLRTINYFAHLNYQQVWSVHGLRILLSDVRLEYDVNEYDYGKVPPLSLITAQAMYNRLLWCVSMTEKTEWLLQKPALSLQTEEQGAARRCLPEWCVCRHGRLLTDWPLTGNWLAERLTLLYIPYPGHLPDLVMRVACLPLFGLNFLIHASGIGALVWPQSLL